MVCESEDVLQAILCILEQAAKLLPPGYGNEPIDYLEKEGIGNYVTGYDAAVQSYIEEKLKEIFPEAVFFAEEMEEEGRGVGRLTVYLDPIDGTANLIRKNGDASISVAIAKEGILELGAVYVPGAGEMFSAQRGKGAFLNGMPIRVSKRSLPESIMIAGAAPYYKEKLGRRSMQLISRLYEKSADFRRYGSAAMEMCQVACGRAEFSFEMKLYPWDYAAGCLIVREAGGIVSTLDGEEIPLNRSSSVLCSNQVVYNEVLNVGRDIRVE